jgi:hypothetical protein
LLRGPKMTRRAKPETSSRLLASFQFCRGDRVEWQSLPS